MSIKSCDVVVFSPPKSSPLSVAACLQEGASEQRARPRPPPARPTPQACSWRAESAAAAATSTPPACSGCAESAAPAAATTTATASAAAMALYRDSFDTALDIFGLALICLTLYLLLFAREPKPLRE